MVKRVAVDGGHSAFTDHRIARRPGAADVSREDPPYDGELRAWREPDAAFQLRNLGLAYMESGAKTRSVFQLNEGFRILSNVHESRPEDPLILSALGRVLLLKRAAEPAVQMLEKAVQLQPRNADALVDLAQARRQAGSPDSALDLLERAAAMDPYLKSAYVLAIDLCDELGYTERGNRILKEFLKRMPENIDAQQAWRERSTNQ